eukprot:TRINITY_DN284_c1_g5_i1.p1 TRINITY_DN284_c1_g5~~TRINITY_DN284_c1_g5_i1.p1  ORF type:complete len:861 (-),score=246.99 TRINITY_DN284_c1_g5_i1:893-3454(-)
MRNAKDLCRKRKAPSVAEEGEGRDPTQLVGTAFSEKDRVMGSWNKEAVDEKGRRLFTGAFKGGFLRSVGYFGTVGSKEGWTPGEFKSRRGERTQRQEARPEDFMDEEDRREMVAASLTTKLEYGAFPGDDEDAAARRAKQAAPVSSFDAMQSLLAPTASSDVSTVCENIGVKLLKKMGWREGRGIGARTLKRKTVEAPLEEATSEPPKKKRAMGPEVPPEIQAALDLERATEENENVDEVEFVSAHVYSRLLQEHSTPMVEIAVKNDFYGVGFDPMSTTATREMHELRMATGEVDPGNRLSMSSVFSSTSGSSNFGLSSLEDADDVDVFAPDSMANYNREITESSVFAIPPPKQVKEPTVRPGAASQFKGFVVASRVPPRPTTYAPPVVPPGFRPFHVFPGEEKELPPLSLPVQGIHNPGERGQMLGEEPPPPVNESVFAYLSEEDRQRLANMTGKAIPGPFDVAMPQKHAEEPKPAEEPQKPQQQQRQQEQRAAQPKTRQLPPAVLAIKTQLVYPNDQGKQRRFEQFMREQRGDVPPSKNPAAGFSEQEWLRERDQFFNDALLFKPLTGIMADRFVCADDSTTVAVVQPPVPLKSEPEEAAARKMFGRLTRTEEEWYPESLLCKRFNVPNPHPGAQPKKATAKEETGAAAGVEQFSSAPTEQFISSGQAPAAAVRQPAPTRLPTEASLLASIAGEAPEEQKEEEERPPVDLFKAIFENEEDQTTTAEAERKEQADAAERLRCEIEANQQKAKKMEMAKETEEAKQQLQPQPQPQPPQQSQSQPQPLANEVFGPEAPPTGPPELVLVHSRKAKAGSSSSDSEKERKHRHKHNDSKKKEKKHKHHHKHHHKHKG